jgi:threonine dehydratase
MKWRAERSNRIIQVEEKHIISSCNEHSPIETPIVQLRDFERIFIKDETVQISGAFKYRGVFAKLKNIPQGTHIVAASTGNHGIAVAEAAFRMGFRAHIFLPMVVPACKLKMLQNLKAEVTIHGEHLDDCSAFAQGWANANGALWVSGFDDANVVQGYLHMFTEITQEIEHIQRVFVPIGGGGLLAAALTYFPNSVEVIGVGSSAVNSLTQSLEVGMPVRVIPSLTIATGLAVPKVGRIAYDLCVTLRPKILLVSDAEIKSAMRILWLLHGVRAEPAGAAALAGALSLNNMSGRSVCIVSGGNVDTAEHDSLIS